MSKLLSYRFRRALSAAFLLVSLPICAFRYFGAGILPYSIDPTTNKVYLLFSRESCGNDAGTWADFGGGAEKGDHNDPLAIATREFSEESIGLFGSIKESKSFFTKSPSTRSYVVRRKNGKDGYALYFAKVEYDRNINNRFQRRLARAQAFKNREKDELLWVSAKRLQWGLQNNRSVIRDRSGRLITIRPSTFKTLQKNAINFIDQLARGKFPRGRYLTIK